MPTQKDLKNFHNWLVTRGRDPTTADLYVTNVKIAYETDDPIERLLDPDISPNTKRVSLAALRAYAKFTKDDDLKETLDDVKLPPVQRIKPRVPLEKQDWKKLRDLINNEPPSPANAIIGLMATRGFRIGDVLRMKRVEVEDALKTDLLIYRAKGNKKLTVGVLPTFVKYLEQLISFPKWKQVQDLFEVDNRAARMRIRRSLQRMAKEVGIEDDMYPHRLRRTVATYFLEKVGGDLTKLKDWFSWSSIATAASYTDHHKRAELDKAGESMFDD